MVHTSKLARTNEGVSISKVTMVTTTLLFQDAKMTANLVKTHGEQFEEKSLTICSGIDYINISYQHIICPDANTAKVSFIYPVHSKTLMQVFGSSTHTCFPDTIIKLLS